MHRYVAAAAVSAVLLLALLVTPTISPRQDAPFYLAAAQGYLTNGFAYQFPREPLYPLFLAALERAGLRLDASLACVQNTLFMAGLYFFLRSMLGSSRRPAEIWTSAALVTLVPTFLVTMNGAMYTESVSCTLIFLLLGSLIRIFGTDTGGHDTRGVAILRGVAWATVAMLASVSLALIKGAFLYVNVAFGLAGAAAAVGFRATRARRTALAVSFLAVAIVSWGGTEIWLASQTPRLAGFQRGGAIFFGRTEFAARFNFRTQTVPFLVNAASESACRWLYYGECASYTFEVENGLGFSESARINGNEQALFERGFRRIAQQPVRQLVFAGFELVRFVLHHGTTGFAELRAPVLGPLVAGSLMTSLLKLFNVLLYLAVPAVVIALRRRGRRWRDVWRAWPEPTRFGTGLSLGYACLYLAVYGFATTLLRMVYPIAPLLVIFDALLIGAARAVLRPEASAP
jgi:hypothetical protein